MKHLVKITLVLIISLIILNGCSLFGFRPSPKISDFSINLLDPPKKYFLDEHMTEAEKDAFEKHGAPDYLRIYWDKIGTIMDRGEAARQLGKKNMSDMKVAWVYLDDGMELVFKNEYNYDMKKIGDKILLIGEYGDPERTEKRSISEGVVQEKYFYYTYGKSFTFLNGELFEQRDFPATGKVIK